jgi:hypothetical protein
MWVRRFCFLLSMLLSQFSLAQSASSTGGGVSDLIGKFQSAVDASAGIIPVVVALLGMIVTITVGWAIVKAIKG